MKDHKPERTVLYTCTDCDDSTRVTGESDISPLIHPWVCPNCVNRKYAGAGHPPQATPRQ